MIVFFFLLFFSIGRNNVKLSIEKMGDAGNEIGAVWVDSLLLFAFASPSAQPFRTPASHSPGGTPPSSASRAGTPHSCHTYRGDDIYNNTHPCMSFKFIRFVYVNEEQLPVFTKE